MKKLIFTLLVTLLFVSCENDGHSIALAGTTWVSSYDDGGYSGKYELTFTPTEATYTFTNSSNNNMTFTGTYTYDPPKVVITNRKFTYFGEPPTGTFEAPSDVRHSGTVNGNTMEIKIYRAMSNIVEVIELRKRPGSDKW